MDVKDGAQPADVYSFAIVCSEVVNMKKAWSTSDGEDANPEGEASLFKIANFGIIVYKNPFLEVIRMIQKENRRPYRPVLQPAVSELSPAMVSIAIAKRRTGCSNS